MTPDERLRRKNEFDGNLVLGVGRFNRQTGRDKHLADVNAGRREEFADPATGLVRPELSRPRVCPVCSADRPEQLFVKEGFPHNRCPECGMIYVAPVLREERLHSHYLGEDSYTRVLMNEIQMEMDRRKFNYGLDLIESFVPGKGRLLDVGCGPGVFLEVARERGWRVEGLEFNAWCVGRVRELGIPVVDSPLEQADLSAGAYQCVTLWTVLEHIVDPRQFLQSIRRLVAPEGVVLVLVPNVDSLAVRILHEKAVTFAGHSHVNHFSPATLTRLLESSGFAMADCETLLTEIGTLNNYLNFEDPYFGDGQSVLDVVTPKYLHEQRMGYLLQAIARPQTN
jgi:2-polyprenyl-3-methyl-5-hydroxy-6-metoxy-1,4-benzoquinol methylase